MQKTFVYLGSLIFVIACLLGVYYIKDSFKILQVNTNPDWESMRFQDWQEYVSPTKKFRVLLPTLPQRLSENVKDDKTEEIRHYDMYAAEKQNGTTFAISLISFPSEHSSDIQKDIVKTFVEEMVTTNPKNELREMAQIPFKGQNATNFHILNDELAINGLAFTKNETLYVLSTIFRKENLNNTEWDFFINSFDLMSEKP